VATLSESDVDLARPGVVWLDGGAVEVRLTGAPRPVARLVDVRQSGGGAVMPLSFVAGHAPGTLEVGGARRGEQLEAIDRWYRREARERIGVVACSEADRLDLEPGRITIRDQRTRWGSCSTSGTLSFNWRLVIGPGHALRYVVIHELVHIRHHNHSRAFWHALSEAMPEWKRSATWLRTNERLLTAYRPAI
jgi:hypothetical protein